jgi:sulfoxide reductase heme-binding subunit YedZ
LNTLQQVRFFWKPAVFVACLLPFTLVVGDLFEITGQLGANPIEEIMDRFGNWSLRFILLTLAVTPVRRISGWNWLARFRRMFGLFTG